MGELLNCLHCQSHSFQRTQPIHSKTFNIIRFPSLDPTYGYIFSSIECTQFLLDDKKPESSSIHSIYKVHVCATIKFKDMSFFLLSELILGSFVMTFGSNGGHVSSRIEISPWLWHRLGDRQPSRYNANILKGINCLEKADICTLCDW
jgi:hypothetical protein